MTSNEASAGPPLAAADPPAAGQARLCAGQGVAAPAGAGRGHGQERGLCAAGQRARRRRISPGSPRRSSRAAARRCLRGGPGRRPVRSTRCRRCSTRRATRTTQRIAEEARALAAPARRRRCPTARWPRSRAQTGAAAQAARRRRRHRLLRRQRPRTGGGPGRRASRPRLQQEDEAVAERPDAAAAPTRRPIEGPHLGDAPGRAGRPHRLGLADPPLHRRRRALQVRAAARATCRGRASCASTCSRASSPTRAIAAPSRCCWRAAGLADPALQRDRRDRPRHRPQGRQVRPRGSGRHHAA